MATGVNFGTQQYFGFDPRTVPGCALWIDALDSNTVTLSGSSITAVRDKSSNAYTFSNATGFTYNVTKFNTSYPSFYAATSTTNHLGSNTSFSLAQPATFFAVCQLTNITTGGYIFDSTNSANRMAFIAYAPTGKPVLFAGVELSNTVSTTFTSPGFHSGLFNSTSSLVFSNGIQTISGNAGAQGATGLILGARFTVDQSWPGHICEILMYNRSITTAERQQVEGYLAWKWGLNTNLPATHPYKPITPYQRLFQPPDLDGLILWLDSADQGSNSMTLSGTTISTWLDRSGNGSNFSSSASPAGSAPVTGTLNNLPIVDTTSGGCFTNGSFSVPATYSGFTTGYSTINSAANTWSGLFYGTPDAIFMLRAYQAQMFLFKGNGSTWGNPSIVTGPSSTTNSIWSVTNPTTTGPGYFWVNGTLNQSNSGVTNIATTGLDIGRWVNNSYPWKGYIGDVIFYNSALSDADRQKVEGYLGWKLGLRGNLPTSHPFYNFPPATTTFNPLQVSGLNAWFDGADPLGTGVLPAENSTLATWSDKSGNGRNASGGVSPTFVSGGVSFDGFSTYLTMSVPYSSNYSVFLVATNTTNTTAGSWFFARRGLLPTGTYPGFVQGFTGTISLDWQEGNGTSRGRISTTPTSPFLASVDHTQLSSVTGYYNGSQAFTSLTPSTYATNAWDTLGTNSNGTLNYYGGTMKEIIFYSNVVGSQDRRRIEGYLAWKWGLQNSLPTSHPYYKFRP